MDRQQAIEMHEALVAELEEVRDGIETLRRRESGLQKVIDGIAELYPDETGYAEEPKVGPLTGSPNGRAIIPRGQEAVQRVLEDVAPRSLTIDELAEEMTQRGWLPKSADPVGAVRASTTRAFTSRYISRRKRGRAYAYRYVSQNSEAPSEAEGF